MINPRVVGTRRFRGLAVVAVLALAALVACSRETAAQKFQFAAIGDTGYSKKSEQEFARMIGAMNREDLAFVVHVGDIQADPRPYERNPDRVSMPCTEESLRKVLATFQTSSHPLILTPGDNDWADCHLLKAQKADPLEQLALVRTLFFPAGHSLGKRTMAVDSQSRDPAFGKFRENLAWMINGVTFATMHFVGSNNNMGRTPEMDAETAERTAANIAWLRKAFADAKARNSVGLVLITQANPGFETHWTSSLKDRYFRLFPGVTPPKDEKPSGFDPLLNALAEEMETYDRPTLFVHGDTHIFHISKPLISKKTSRFVDHFTRLEVFGDPDSHWVRVTVDPAKAALFTVEPEIVPENRAR